MPGPQDVVDREQVDFDILSTWMEGQGLGAGTIEVAELLAGGTQNILLRFERAGRAFVLRRPPPHLRKNSNETMRREARVLAAIGDSAVPHPRLIAGCPDETVIGASFYLMEPIDGFNPTGGLPDYHAGDPAVRRAMGLSLVDGIAALGAVDYLEVGLEGFGKPEGYLERQVERWRVPARELQRTRGLSRPRHSRRRSRRGVARRESSRIVPAGDPPRRLSLRERDVRPRFACARRDRRLGALHRGRSAARSRLAPCDLAQAVGAGARFGRGAAVGRVPDRR